MPVIQHRRIYTTLSIFGIMLQIGVMVVITPKARLLLKRSKVASANARNHGLGACSKFIYQQ